MKNSIQHLKKIPPVAFMIIVISIILYGHYGWNIWLSSPETYYPLKFSNAKWIGIEGNLPQGYYRKEIYINEPVRNAWLKIAASDSYQLYVNGELTGKAMFSSTEVSGIYDVTGHLSAGKNVIAVCVRRFNIHEINKVRVELGYENKMGIKRVIGSDHTWKVAPVEEWQAHGKILWNFAEFDDSSWKGVDIIEAKTAFPLWGEGKGDGDPHFVKVNPALFEMPLDAHWMWAPDTSINSIVMQYPFSLSGKVRDAWLRIATDGKYQLYINEERVSSSETSKGYLDIYNIDKFIKKGKNSITIIISKEPSSPGILIDGFLSFRPSPLRGEGNAKGDFSNDNIYRFTENNWSVAPLNKKVFKPVALFASYHQPSDSVLTKRFIDPSITGMFRFKNIINLSLWLSLIGVVWIIVWIGCAFFISMTYGITLNSALFIDAVTHLPSILLLVILYLLKYDINHNISFPYQNIFFIISILLIFFLKILFLIGEGHIPYLQKTNNMGSVPTKVPLMWQSSYLRNIPIVILIALVIIGGYIRINGLDDQSLYHDEIHMINYIAGIFEKGYPYKMIGPIERPLATYELVPYPIAISMSLLGSNEFAYRLPAALLGTITILLIYFISASIFNRWSALLASAIYTFLPPAIVWAKYLWHPQQAQFFALITSFLFYKAIEKERINKRYLYMATVAYIMLYLTWEGTGFFLGSLFLGLLAVKGKNFEWIREKHLWIGAGIIIGVVLIQLVRRFLLQIPYLVVGTGLSEITAPSLFFLNPMYDPYFYVKNFLWREYNFILTSLCILGIPFVVKHRSLRYLYTLLFATIFMMTNLFAANAIRYVIYLEPLLIISATSVLLYIARYLLQPVKEISLRSIEVAVYILLLIAGIILWTGTNDHLYKFYRVSDAHPYGYHWRFGDYYFDFRSPNRFLSDHYKKGDLVIAVVPDATELYGGIETDYFVQSVTARQVLYDITGESPMYLERIIGKPTLRGFSEFNDITNRHQRIWVVSIPDRVFQRIADSSILEYLIRNGKVVYESYNARIYLLGG